MAIKFDSEPVYGGNDKYIKTKVKMGKKYTVLFKGKKFQKKMYHRNIASYCIILIILVDSIIRASKRRLSSNTFRRV